MPSPAPRPFRFSLQAVEAATRRDWVDLVKRADDAGFDLLVTADHLGGCLDPLLPLATAAAVSERLRLGVMVLNNDFHHPALLARQAATLDLLSDGRAEVGLGAGHAWPEYEAAGLAFDPPGTRVDRLEEAVTVLCRLLDGETVTSGGPHYRLAGQRCDPLPVQPHVPVLVGGAGRRVLSIGARLGDAVGFTGLGRTLPDGRRHETGGFRVEAVDADVAAVRAATAAAGRAAPVEHQVLVQLVAVTDDARGTAEELAATRVPSLSADDLLTTPYVMVGSAAGLVERLLEQRERWGFSHYTVRPDALGQIEPVIAELAGR
ncbi:MAG TPA: TIGR03621 family F420-dependent LLM class oxidoreductase [Acidimicrobiales bacterium]|nr:TIGR03621 family F420-dependent LLM class oxidoreductase [Acidimicrobiales bacterium]